MFGRLLLAAVLTAALAPAQRGGGGGGRGGGMDSDEMSQMRPAQRQTRFDLFADKLKLNKDQKENALTALGEAFAESAPVRQQMEKSRVAIAVALIDGKSGDELKKLMDDYTAAVAQMTGIEAKVFAKLYAALKPNQQSKAAQAFELMAEALDITAGGRGAGGGRGDRGRGR